MKLGNIGKKIVGGALKGALGALTGGDGGSKNGGLVAENSPRGRDDKRIENARTKAENQARGTKWSQSEQKGFELYQKMNPDTSPAKFDALPKAERKTYVDTAKDLGQKSAPGPTRAVASADGFTPSSELSSKGKDSANLGTIMSGLAQAFG